MTQGENTTNEFSRTVRFEKITNIFNWKERIDERIDKLTCWWKKLKLKCRLFGWASRKWVVWILYLFFNKNIHLIGLTKNLRTYEDFESVNYFGLENKKTYLSCNSKPAFQCRGGNRIFSSTSKNFDRKYFMVVQWRFLRM